MAKIKVLFVCVHNSARSQIAEAFLNRLDPENFIAESAGIEPGTLNPFVIEAMKEIGMDISGNKTESVFDFFKQGKIFNYVITVCESKAAERCPGFMRSLTLKSWDIEDPSFFQGTDDEILEKTRAVRDRIKSRVELFIEEVKKLMSLPTIFTAPQEI